MARTLIGLSFLGQGCAPSALPDPEPTARAYAAALGRGDAEAVHELLTRDGQKDYGVGHVRRLLSESERELAQGAAVSPSAMKICRAEPEATVELEDGTVVRLESRGGHFELLSPPGLGGRPLGILAALGELRLAIRRRDLPRLLELLSAPKREELERTLSALDQALEDPRTFDQNESLGVVVVRLGDGTRVTLALDDGSYRIVEIE